MTGSIRWLRPAVRAAAFCLFVLALPPGPAPRAVYATRAHDAPRALSVMAEIPMGTMGAVALSGDAGYLGLGPRVVTLDLTDPAVPAVAGWSVDLGGAVEDIALGGPAGDRLYVAAGAAGLVVLDVRDASRPLERSRLPGRVRAVKVEGDRVYALGESLRVLEPSDAGPPTEIGRIELPIEAFDVAGGIAWLAVGAAGILSYDLSDPTRPAPVGSLDTPGSAHDIRVAGGHAYVADGGRRFTVLDVARPDAPVLAAELLVDLAAERECGQGSDDCGLDAQRVRVEGEDAVLVLHRYLGAFNGRSPARLVRIDIGAPEAPRELGQRNLRGNPSAVALDRGRLLAAERPLWWYAGIAPCQLAEGGLGLYDAALEPLGRLDAPSGANAVQLDGERVWLADTSRRLRVYALSASQGPRPVSAAYGAYGSPYGSAEARDLVVGDDRARMALGGQTAGFLSRAAAAEVRPAGGAASPNNGCAPPDRTEWFTRIATDGTLDHLVDMAGGIQIFEPGAPRPIGRFQPTDDATAVAAGRGLAVVTGAAGLEVVDVADPTAPAGIGRLELPGFAADVAVTPSVDLAALVGAQGLGLVDLRRPDAPRELARVATTGGARAVALAGRIAYVAVGSQLQAFDLSDAARPIERARAENLRDAFAVAAGAEHVAVLAAGGLYLLAPLPDDADPGPTVEPPVVDRALYLPLTLRSTPLSSLATLTPP